VQPLIDSLNQNPDVDAVIPAYADFAVAVNVNERLSSPLFTLEGLDPAGAANLPDLRDVDGGTVKVGDLADGEIYLNESAVEDLDLKAGDTVTLFTLDKRQDFKVKAVIEDKRLGGSIGVSTQREGGVVPLEVAQSFFNSPGQITMLAISNKGDARGGYNSSDAVVDQIESQLPQDANLEVTAVKQQSVDLAEEFGNIFTTFFLAFGLFSIGAGVLLIFMIFVMLAAERKSEMGMARAVGTRRFDLVQTFLSEGMGYNVLAAAVGTGLGIIVAVIITSIMASLLSDSNLDISPHVTLRSLVVSYSLGVVLTFLTVTFSSWRISLINIVRAIRDIPEPPPESPQWHSHGILGTIVRIFFQPTDRAGWIRRGVGFVALVLAVAGAAVPVLMMVALLLFLGTLFSFFWAQKAMPALMRIVSFLGTILVLPVTNAVTIFRTLQLGPVLLLLGSALLAIFVATDSDDAYLIMSGLSLTPLGLILIIRSFGAPERPLYTALGVYLIYIWEFDIWNTGTGFGIIQKIFGEANGGIEMFFVSGVMVTLAATFLVVYNGDIILGPISKLGKGLGAWLPSLRMAIAYPLANKMRTGMTMAMFCLVIFALTVMSSMNHNFNRLFLSDRSLGGWDIAVEENPNSPLPDLQGALQDANSPVVGDIDAVGRVEVQNSRDSLVCQVTADQPCDTNGDVSSVFTEYVTKGMDPSFVSTNQIPFQARAKGYGNDAAVWQAIAKDDSLAVIDANALASSGGFGGTAFVEGIDARDTSFEPFDIVILDPESGNSRKVTVIGLIEMGASTTYPGLAVSESTFDGLFAKPDSRTYYVKTVSGADNIEAARQIESSLITTGAQADSLKKLQQDASETSSSFFYLMQGFMGLGLFVGVAAVGVIAFRTVVERRQQIGMLRAIGYNKMMIGLTFLFESAFIALMGVVSGIVFALILARQLVTESFANQGVTTFSVPWTQVLLIGGVAFVFALIMTLIPSRQAASIPIAEALRYE
jgi:putative ABC transport system permease protein